MSEEKQFITTREQLQDQVDQVVFDLKELVRSADYDEVDEIGPNLPMFQGLLNDMEKFKEQLDAGTLPLATGQDMPWARLLKNPQVRFVLPVYFELKQINLAQKNGVD